MRKNYKNSDKKKNKLKDALEESEIEKDKLWEKLVKINSKFKTEMNKKEK